MNPEAVNYWNIIKDFIKDIAIYIMPISAFIVSLIALKRSKNSVEVQLQLSEVEQKLKEYDLALKTRELEKIQALEDKKAFIEARVIKISQGKYKLKVWNSGTKKAYNIDVSIPSEYSVILMRRNLPFEYLEPNDSFEEHVVVHGNTSSKFEVVTSWENEDGEKKTNNQLRSI